MTATVVSGPRPSTARPILRRGMLGGASVAVVALDVHLISPFVARATSALSHPAFYWVLTALAAEIVSVLATAHLQRRMLRATGTRVPMPRIVRLAYASYAMSISLPAGTAVSAGYTFRRLRQLGATSPAAGFTLISSAVLSALAYGLLAVAGFTVAGGSSGGPVAVVLGVGVAVLLVVTTRSLLRHPEIVERFGLWALRVTNRILRRERDAGMRELRKTTRMLTAIRPRSRDWAAGLGAALINWFADLGCLFACCQAVGAHGATIGVVALAYLAGTSVSGISLVPGGLGVLDAAVIVVLVQNGVGTGPAAAAVLLYRVVSFGFNVLTGWSAWVGHAWAVRRGQVVGPAPVATPQPSTGTPNTPTTPTTPTTPKPGGIMTTTHDAGHPTGTDPGRPTPMVFVFPDGRALSPTQVATLRVFAAAGIRPLCAGMTTPSAIAAVSPGRVPPERQHADAIQPS